MPDQRLKSLTTTGLEVLIRSNGKGMNLFGWNNENDS
jgi:hypothetical protein